MAAIDTFESYVAMMPDPLLPSVQRYIREQREYLLTLRSEDERVRLVAEVREEIMGGLGE